jgi:5'-nucleotidase
LYEGNYLCKEYQEQAQALFDHYYPIEQDPSIDRQTKQQAMNNRRSKHLDLMIQYKLSRSDIINIVQEESLQLRDNYEQFFDIINTQHIPLIIMSASGIGYDAIDAFFQYKSIDQTYIDIVSNIFIWDDK